MKLLPAFKEQVGKLGKLRRVWFTSFNLSVDFVETHLLPVVLGMDPPRTRMDYEAIQKELTDQNIDFRIFCDKRMMNRDDNKRTSIEVYGVSPRQLDGFSKDSLFHPKVIYLEDSDGRAVLGAGSANLTLSGWGRNQEAFAFRKVRTDEQTRQIQGFFKQLLLHTGDESKLYLGKNYWGKDTNWSFVHSFQDETFLDQLFANETGNQLVVWSPYFPENLPAYIARLKHTLGQPDLRIAIVPDRAEGKYIRTKWHDDMRGLLDSGVLAFHDNPTTRHDSTELCHAKIWKTASKIAIGSWNFTGPGSNNMLDDNQLWLDTNNIEAGFLMDDNHSIQDAVGSQLVVTQSDFSSDDMLQDDALVVPDELPFEIRVYFDWQEQVYRFEGMWVDNGTHTNYQLKLPACKVISLTGKRRESALGLDPVMVSSSKELLTNHHFDVLKEGNVAYRGLIIESTTEFRSVQTFDTLSDLLDNLIAGYDPETTGSAMLREELQIDRELFEEDSVAAINTTTPVISYFRLFQATDLYETKIRETTNMDQLEKLVFVYPGSLQELSEKAQAKLLASKPEVFNWFLAQEVNQLVSIARKQYAKVREKGTATPVLPPDHKWSHLELKMPALPEQLADRHDFIKLISMECQYGNH